MRFFMAKANRVFLALYIEKAKLWKRKPNFVYTWCHGKCMRHGAGKPEIIFHLLFGAAAKKKTHFFYFFSSKARMTSFYLCRSNLSFAEVKTHVFLFFGYAQIYGHVLCGTMKNRFYKKKKKSSSTQQKCPTKKNPTKMVFFLRTCISINPFFTFFLANKWLC